MCCGGNNNQPVETKECACLGNILEKIIKLQNRSEKIDCAQEGCDKPFLGPTPSIVCYNTRPVTFYRCCDGELWSFPYTYNGTSGYSNIFRVENVDGCCATCRILANNPDTSTADVSPYVATESFFTINLNCVGALKCLPDTHVACI